jgi:hypothetical protein
MTEHKLVDDELKREGNMIVARCTCGWTSQNFTSLAASVLFRDHCEQATRDEQEKPE